jgi:cation diffusion facilitator family transporter
MEKMRSVRRILWAILFLNVAVALAKVFYGHLSSSLSITADGFHSLGDGTANVIGLIGVWIASQPADADHPYGHKKFETYTTVGIAALLLFVSFQVVAGVIGRIRHPVIPEITGAGFVVMLTTLAVNVGVFRYEVRQGRRLGSDFLVSDAHHTRSDILVSLSVLGGMVGVRLGLFWLDWVLGMVIAVLIAYSAWEIIRDSAQVLCDAAVLPPEAVVPLVQDIAGVDECHMVRSRGRADAVYVDLHVHVHPDMTVAAAHNLAHQVEDRLKGRLPGVVDVLVHVEPAGDFQKT